MYDTEKYFYTKGKNPGPEGTDKPNLESVTSTEMVVSILLHTNRR